MPKWFQYTLDRNRRTFLKSLLGGSTIIFGGLNDGTPIELAQQTEVESLKSSVSEGKSLIASAITDKGVSTSSTATFQTMATNIGKIATDGLLERISSSSFSTYEFDLSANETKTIYAYKGVIVSMYLDDTAARFMFLDLKNTMKYIIYGTAYYSTYYSMESGVLVTGQGIYGTPSNTRPGPTIESFTTTRMTFKGKPNYGSVGIIAY